MAENTRVFTDATQSSPSGCKKLGKHGSRKGAVRPGSAGHTSTAEASTYYYHSDHLGSAHLITDYKGDEYERVEYTPYGEYWIEKRAPENKTLPFKFTGKERDEETGLYYYGARYLDPRTGRWLTTDPALGDYIPMSPVNDEAKKHNQNLPGMGGIYNTVNMHLYHYAGNNPVKYIDPDGESVQNNTKHILLIKSEEGSVYTVLKPGEFYAGDHDGILCHDGTTFKEYGKTRTTVTQDKKGKFKADGGKLMNFLGNIAKFLKNLMPNKKRHEDNYGEYKYEGDKTKQEADFLHSWWEDDKEIDRNNDKQTDTINGEDLIKPILPDQTDREKNIEDTWKKLGEINDK